MPLTQVTYAMIDGESINVKDFGAVGDGVADDTAAIQSAINYCTSLSNRKMTLYFPASKAGTAGYRVTSPLNITGRLSIVGDGPFSTLIYADSFSVGQSLLNFNMVATDIIYWGGVRDITLRSSNYNPRAIRLNNASYWLLKNVELYGFNVGIYITGTNCFSNYFEQVVGYDISSYTIQFDNFTGGGQYEFLACTFTGADGFYVSSTADIDSISLYNCNWEQCDTTDMYVNGRVFGLTISGGRSEGLNGLASFLIDPVSGKSVNGLTITGFFWQTDSGNAYPVQLGGSGGSIKGFQVCGNYAGYVGFLGFVNLNGAGEAGVISGNYCFESPVGKIVSAPRQGVVAFSNYNQSGAMIDYQNLVAIGRASAAPTTGTYAAGSIVYNSSPSAGGTVGWVCVTSGTPGTWKTFGTIAS